MRVDGSRMTTATPRRTLWPRLPAGERGFTTIELMVVVLVIAILMGIAIPVFLGLRTRAQDRVAQAAVAGVLKAQIGYFSGGDQTFTADVGVLELIEPAFSYEGQGPDTCNAFPNPYCVRVELFSPTEVMLTVRSESGTYWSIRDLRNAPGQGTYFNAGGDSVPPAPDDVTADSW